MWVHHYPSCYCIAYYIRSLTFWHNFYWFCHFTLFVFFSHFHCLGLVYKGFHLYFFYFLVRLHFNLLSKFHRIGKFIPALFATRMATQMITQVMKCYRFSCHFSLPQKRYKQKVTLLLSTTLHRSILKWLWNVMKTNSSAEFHNVDSTRAVILV
jgi:hypothetical protein